jgi:hypothetical protein
MRQSIHKAIDGMHVGAIDRTHVSISKPKFGPIDCFYFKLGGYFVELSSCCE